MTKPVTLDDVIAEVTQMTTAIQNGALFDALRPLLPTLPPSATLTAAPDVTG
jgi:hypothetical protein